MGGVLGEEPVPRKIDRYEILRKLATGGMAELFLAKQSGLEGFEKVVVIKRILSHLAQDEEFVSMFLDEARIAAKLSHPNIVQIYDLGKADDSYYIAMEYVSGRNVQHIMTRQAELGGTIPVEHACRIIAGVCEGLYYAHSRKDYDGRPLNIVHRDISPQNILVSFAGGVKVVDFGIAKASTQLAQTRAGVLKGKYAYMSPEQVRGQKVDHRSDIFALGLVMYEMLTGRRAFERESSLKTLKAIVQEKPLNPRELNPEVPVEVVKLLSRALEKNPDRRYRNAQEMQLALEDYLESSPRKSNNVRLSRYLYDLFDDELKSEYGTMVVEGIGEVIIPTGAAGAERREEPEEEIDAKTLTAALMPGAPEPESTRDGPGSGAMRKRNSEPGVRVVRDDKQARGGDGGRGEASGKNGIDHALEKPSLEEPGISPEDLKDDESGDDKTIPVYSMEDYERQRAERGLPPLRSGDPSATDEVEPERVDDNADDHATVGGISPSSWSGASPAARVAESTAMGQMAALSAPGGSAEGFSQESTAIATVDDARAAALLAKVEAMAEGAGLPSRSGEFQVPSIPGQGGSSLGASSRWEGPTHEHSGGSAASKTLPTSPTEGLRSSEAVIGPQGPVPASPEVVPGIRPPAAPSVRPAARPLARRQGSIKEIAPPVSRSHPTSPAPGGSEESGGREATPATARHAAAGDAKSPSPGLVMVALAALIGFFVLAVVGVVVLLVVVDDQPSVAQPVVRKLRLSTNPPGAQIEYAGKTYTAPADLWVPSGAAVRVSVSSGEGKPVEFEIQVPPGGEPMERTLELGAP